MLRLMPMFDDWRLQRMNLVILFYVYIYVHFVVCSSAFLLFGNGGIISLIWLGWVGLD